MILGTDCVYSCHWGLNFFVYYKGGKVLEGSVAGPAPLARQAAGTGTMTPPGVPEGCYGLLRPVTTR